MKFDVQKTVVTEMRPVEVETKTVVLTLTEDEARVLYAIVGKINGSDSSTVRKLTNVLYKKLGEIFGCISFKPHKYRVDGYLEVID